VILNGDWVEYNNQFEATGKTLDPCPVSITKMKIIRNKNCKECPKNKREDMVWQKGCQDGFELGLHYLKAIIEKN